MNSGSSSNEINVLSLNASNKNTFICHRNHTNHRNYDNNLNITSTKQIESKEQKQSIEQLPETKWCPRVVNVIGKVYDDKYEKSTKSNLGSGTFGVVFQVKCIQDPKKL